MTTETTEHPRNGSITAGLTTGIIGTALGALNTMGSGNGSGLLGLGGNSDKCVSKETYEAGMKLAAKDSEIALLKSEHNDALKMIEIYAELNKQIECVKSKVADNRDRADDKLDRAVEKLNCKIDFNKSFQDGINAQQLAYNGTNSATITCIQNQVAQLQGMTKLVIPNYNLCPGVPTVQVGYASPSLSAIA